MGKERPLFEGAQDQKRDLLEQAAAGNARVEMPKNKAAVGFGVPVEDQNRMAEKGQILILRPRRGEKLTIVTIEIEGNCSRSDYLKLCQWAQAVWQDSGGQATDWKLPESLTEWLPLAQLREDLKEFGGKVDVSPEQLTEILTQAWDSLDEADQKQLPEYFPGKVLSAGGLAERS